MDEWSAQDSAPQGSRRRRFDAVTVTLAVLLVLMSGVTGGAFAAALRADNPTAPAAAPRASGTADGQPPLANNARPGTSPSSGQPDDGTSPTADPAAIGRKVAPGIVNIDTWIGYQQARAAGTGMVLTPTGEVLTNNHVIKGATRIRATVVGTGRAYAARVVGYDRSHDVAVLQLVGASGLPTVDVAPNAPVGVGQRVVAVGNAGGKGGEPVYAGGVVTALDRSITASDQSDGTSERLTDLIETDAEVVPGDSGGALADTDGDVVGLITAATEEFRFSAGSRGYAIPIGDALGIARQIRQGEASATVHVGPTAMLGVAVQTAGNPASSYRFGQNGGALVAGVLDGGPAESAGLTAGDVITGIDDRRVASADDLSDLMIVARPGSTVTVGYVDDADGQPHTAQLRLAVGPPQ